MMLKIRYIIAFLIISGLSFRCSPSKEANLQNFNAELWKSDRAACKGNREKEASALLPQLDSLKGMNQAEVMALLGRPDITELSARNTKVYHYYYTFGGQCNGASSPSDTAKQAATKGKTFRLRFNAIGLVNEVLK